MGARPEAARDRPKPARADRAPAGRAAERTTRPGLAPPEAARIAAVPGDIRRERSVPRRPWSARLRWLDGLAQPCRLAAQILLLVAAGIPVAWSRDRRRLRVFLAAGAVGFAAIVFLAPLAWAGRLDSCAAAEVALVDKAISRDGSLAASKARVVNWTGADGRLLSHGRVGREIAAREYAGWPAFAGCTALFWRARWEVASFGGLTAVLTRALSFRR